MKRILTFILAVSFFAVSCEKEQLPEPTPEPTPTPEVKPTPVFSAAIDEAQTKTTLDGMKIYWGENDQISINGKLFQVDQINESDKRSASFREVNSSELTGSSYTAYYPAILYQDGVTKMPSIWSYANYTGEYNMPMYAHSETTSLKFKVICGVFAIKVSNASGLSSVKSITISSSDSALSGAFSVSNDAATLLNSTQSDAVMITYEESVSLDQEKTFYLPLPVQDYRNIEIEVSDGTTSKFMVTKENQKITIARRTLYTINFQSNFTPATVKVAVVNEEDNDARH